MSSRYFCRLEKKRGTELWIAAIRGTDGKIAADIDGICRSWVDFFSTLLSADVLDLKVQEDLLENLSLRLPSSSSASCDGPITLDEARKALEGAAIGRSPGSDGLSAEFYLAFWKVLGEDLIEAKECDICEKTGHIAKDCPFRGKCLRCGQAGHLYRDCRNEPVAATTPGPRELPVDPEDNRTGEAMESDSLANRPVPPVEFVPASIVSSDGFIPIRRRAKRKRARIFESSDVGNDDNCLVNDNNGDTASSENGETVDIIIDDVNSDSNNIVSGQASNSSVANDSTASMNDNSTNNNISCDISHTSNINSSKDDNNSSNSNSSDDINNCSDNSNNDTSCAASCSGVSNDISSGDIISNCVVSDNTTDITDYGNDIGNSNSSNVNNCQNDKNIVVNNASSSHGNNSNIISNIDCSTILVDNVPSNANGKIDKVNDNDNNNSSITWDDVMAMEDAARELEEVPVPASPPVIDPSMARTARRSDRLQQSHIPRRLTRASAKSKT
ncbi:PREDICTED: uncharacterized protein DDB_G0288805-like [Acropora digitifera]|uniref:uncharacterized protein DDB_G0288805-like n=1 Tax=Acropora digitifera TaxID=70779 RepID=UPI00077A1973|nr:PREDICTED: uncharacterized protein DDB_G0288805-like [Acropora digitifera]